MRIGTWIGSFVVLVACGSGSRSGAAATTPSSSSRVADLRASCVALDADRLDDRTRAMHVVLDALALAVEGGTEQQMEEAARHCDETYALRPRWYHAPSAAVEADLRLLVGGSFSPDHLGPARYEELRARVASSPEAYLDGLDAMLAHADVERLSSWYPEVVFEITRGSSPDATRRAVGRAAIFYRAVSVGLPTSTDEERATVERLGQRMQSIRTILVELDADWHH